MEATLALQQRLLLRAAADGKIGLCKRILVSLVTSSGSGQSLKSVILEARDESGATPLILAARFGHGDVVRLFLQLGANPRASSTLGNTAMHWACIGAHLDIVQYLSTAEPALLTCRNVNGDSPLMWASSAGHDSIVALIVEHDSVAADAEKRHSNHEGINAIMCAAMGGHARILQRLLSGASHDLFNSCDANGNTALHLSVRGQHGACVRVLLAHNPDLCLNDRKGLSVLDLMRRPDACSECVSAIEAHLDERRRSCAAVEHRLLQDEEIAGAVATPASEIRAASWHQFRRRLQDLDAAETPSSETSDDPERLLAQETPDNSQARSMTSDVSELLLVQSTVGENTLQAPSDINEESRSYRRMQGALDELVGDAGRELDLIPEHILGLDLDHLSASQLDAAQQALQEVASRIRSVRRRLQQQVVLDLGAQVVALTARLDKLTDCRSDRPSP